MGAGSWIREAGIPACHVVSVSTCPISLTLKASRKEERQKYYIEIFRSPFLWSLICVLRVIKKLLNVIG